MFFLALQFSFSLSIDLTLYSPTHGACDRSKRIFKTRHHHRLHPILDYGFSWIENKKPRKTTTARTSNQEGWGKAPQPPKGWSQGWPNIQRCLTGVGKQWKQKNGGACFSGLLLRLRHSKTASSLTTLILALLPKTKPKLQSFSCNLGCINLNLSFL